PGFVAFDDATSATPLATVSAPGRYHLQVTASASGATSSSIVEFDVLDSYATWVARTLPGVPPAFAAPGFDLDTDGLSNLLEYTLGLSPIFPDTHPFSALSHSPGTVSTTYRQRYIDNAEVDLAFQSSPDLKDWIPAAMTITVVADDGRTRTIRATNTLPTAEITPAHFIRAKATLR
ncbi:MAG: hypothetical protein P8J87_03320, partial [Verrucomicrobiales bacterium]|nr:hypothetical protein [Verrucomicrobiales bacterium]